MTAIGQFRYVVSLEAPGPPELDDAGGYVETWAPLAPAGWHCSIEMASAADVERIGAGTIATTATVILRGRYHADLVAKGQLARVRFHDRVFEIASVHDRDARGIELEVLAREVTGTVQGAAALRDLGEGPAHGARATTH
jgi:head-tail adaptor